MIRIIENRENRRSLCLDIVVLLSSAKIICIIKVIRNIIKGFYRDRK